MHFHKQCSQVRNTQWALPSFCFRNDPCEGISWFATQILLPSCTGRHVLCQTCKLDSIVFWFRDNFAQRPEDSLREEAALPYQLSRRHAHCSQEGNLTWSCWIPRHCVLDVCVSLFRSCPLGQQGGLWVSVWHMGVYKEKVFQGLNWGLEWHSSLIWGITTYCASRHSQHLYSTQRK